MGSAKARFFFHFCDGETSTRDELGLDFASVEEAYMEAISAARAMWPELLADRRDPRGCAFEIANGRGQVLFRLEFIELLEICRPSGARPSDTGGLGSQPIGDVGRSGAKGGRNALDDESALLAQLRRNYRDRVPK